jgi:hypothetical protein
MTSALSLSQFSLASEEAHWVTVETHSMTFRSTKSKNEKARIYGAVGILTGDSEIASVRDSKESKTQLRLVAN